MTNPFDFQSMLHSVSKISLTGGVVDKVCKVLICIAMACAIIAWSVKTLWVSVAALAMVFLICFPILWRLVTFADRNPQAAILEGAQFLMHEQLRLGMKETPELPTNPDGFVEAEPVHLTPEEEATLQQPDQDTSQLPDEGQEGQEEDHG